MTPPPIDAPAISELRIPDGRPQHTEALDPSIVNASLVSPGMVGVRGVRPGDTMGFGNLTFQQGDVGGDLVSGGEYRVDVHPTGGIHVTAASLLETPLLDFGIAPTWGVDARAPWGLEAIGTPLGVQLLQHVAVSHQDLFAGFTPLGPLTGIELSGGAFSVHATALFSTGQVQTAESLSFRAGDVSLTYAAGPFSNGVIGRLTCQPLDFIVSVGSSGSQFGLAYTMRGGQTLQVLWSSPNGLQVVFTAALGDTATRVTAMPGRI